MNGTCNFQRSKGCHKEVLLFSHITILEEKKDAAIRDAKSIADAEMAKVLDASEVD